MSTNQYSNLVSKSWNSSVYILVGYFLVMRRPYDLVWPLNFMDDSGAGMARNDSMVESMELPDPFFHRDDKALPTNITACDDPWGIVAAIRARRGISVCVDCDKVENDTSINR